jgi:hypothetical protein
MFKQTVIPILALAPLVTAISSGLIGEPLAPRMKWVDLEGDGRLEVFVANPRGGDQFFRSGPDGRYVDITESSGLETSRGSHGALWFDVENDLDKDLLTWGETSPTRLWRNEGNGLFVEITRESGLALELCDKSIEAVDFDADGLFDLQRLTATGDRLFHNDGRGQFSEVDLAELFVEDAPNTSSDPRKKDPDLAGPRTTSGGSSSYSLGNSLGGGVVTNGGGQQQASAAFACAGSVEDMSNPGTCVPLSSVPTLGTIYPLGLDFNIDGAGNVGFGTLSPTEKLDVIGSVNATGQFHSAEAVLPPFDVSSSARVESLNADLLDGMHASQFTQLGQLIDADEIAHSSILGIHLAAGSVGSNAILDSTIQAEDIGADEVNALHIATGAVGSDQLAADSVGSSELAAAAVGSSELASSAVTSSKIAAGAVGASQIAAGAVDSSEIASNAVTSTELADNSVGASEIATGAVGSLEIASNAVTSTELADNSVGASEIATGAVGSSELGANSVYSSEIASSAVGSDEIASNAVGASEIATGAVGTSEIADNSVTSLDLATNSVGSSEIASNAVGASEIATGAVGTSEIADNSVTSLDLATNSVDSSEIAANAVGSSELADGSVGYNELADDSVDTKKIVNGTVQALDMASPLTYGGSGPVLSVENTSSLSQADGLKATTYSSSGIAVDALAYNTGESVNYGVKAFSGARYGYGVWSRSNGLNGTGVKGEALSGSAIGVLGYNSATTGSAVGLQGVSRSTSGRAIYGRMEASSGSGQGVRGWTASSAGYGIYSSGNFGGTGAKYFIQPHPLDASKQINFVCLEGNESGTYFRGTGHVLNGTAVIEVPEDFRLVTDAEGLTVQVTVVGSPAMAWVETQDLDQIVVRANVDVTFHYMVNGVRRGFTETKTIRENTSFVPTVRDLPYGSQYPEDLRQILVENGTLNPDFTPNRAKAAEMGWILTERLEGSMPE